MKPTHFPLPLPVFSQSSSLHIDILEDARFYMHIVYMLHYSSNFNRSLIIRKILKRFALSVVVPSWFKVVELVKLVALKFLVVLGALRKER